MPRGKKARTEEREKKPKAVKGKKKSKDESKPAEEDKKKDHTLSEITAYLNDNKGNLEAINEFKELMLKSSLSKKLVNSTISTIFDIVEKNPTQLQWGKACIEAVNSKPSGTTASKSSTTSVQVDGWRIGNLGSLDRLGNRGRLSPRLPYDSN